MDAERESPEALWARLRSEDYGSDPETKATLLWEEWQAAGEDFRRRRDVGGKAAAWLREELTACARIGRLFLGSIPPETRAALDEGSELGRPYRDLLGLFNARVEECLRRAVGLSTRFLDGHALTPEVSAAVVLAEHSYEWLAGFRGSDRPAL